jgi:DNA (cytosine-5)-methyltransferase 1
MTKLTEEQLQHEGPISLLVGGTPCQSFSVAGLRKGLEDPRGNLELGYGFAYRVLDAQWFGVAQRRRRVFVVAHARDWRCAAAVLFERESVFGDSPTRGAKGEGITSSPQGIAGNVSSKWAKGTGGPAVDECYNLVAFAQNQREEVRELGDCATALNLQGTHQQTFLAAVDLQNVQVGVDLAGTLDTTRPSRGGGQAVAQGFTYSGYSNQPAWMTGDRTDCLPASGHSDGSHQGVGVVAFDTYNHTCADVSQTLQRGTGTDQIGAVMSSLAVRRLTPKECERLQGFPDDYTLVTYRNKPAADGPRYKALGNSMAVPVMRWIGERIASVDSLNGAT